MSKQVINKRPKANVGRLYPRQEESSLCGSVSFSIQRSEWELLYAYKVIIFFLIGKRQGIFSAKIFNPWFAEAGL